MLARAGMVGASILTSLACTAGQPGATVRPPATASADETSLGLDEPAASTTAASTTEPAPLTRDEIRVVVRAKLPQVRGCFELGLADDPTLAGRLALRFTIDASGRVRDPSVVEDQLGVAAISACLLEQVGHWQFPLPVGGRELTIVYPFHFTAEEALRAAGLPRVEGSLRPAAVGELFDAHRDELDACLRDAGMTTGKLGVAFTIDDAGVVTKIASYQTSLTDAATRCLLRTISSWTFPAAAPGDEARVNHDLAW